MRPLFIRLIATLCLTSLVACTSMRPVVAPGSAPLSAQQLGTILARDDQLMITHTDGRIQKLTLTNVLPDAIEGTLNDSAEVTRIELDHIKKIDRRVFDGTKTTFLVITVVGGIYLLAEAVGSSAGSVYD